MPKKTKKQKIEAQRNRLQKKKEVNEVLVPKHSTQTPSYRPVPAAQKQQKELKKVSVFKSDEETVSYFKHDLMKSLMIMLLLVCVQVGIYVAQLSGIIDITNLIIY